jgi:hypothetical protein
MDNPSGRVDQAAGDSSRTGGSVDDPSADLDRRTREIRRQIDETRADMAETIETIQDRITPRNVVAQAKDSVKSAATQRVREMADTASDTTQRALDYTRQRANDAMGSARQNAIPLALIGVGAAWLLTNRLRERDLGETRNESFGYGGAWREQRPGEWREDPPDGGVTSSTGEYASPTVGAVRRMARRRQNQLQRMVEENPLLVGAGALMLGAAFGMAVPETDTENEWMGEARDNMVSRAREMARDAAEQVQSTASSVADAAKNVSDSTRT